MLEPQPVALIERIVQALARADASRTTLSRDLGVSRSTLGRGLAGLIERGFVTATSQPDKRRGRPTEQLHLDKRVPFTAGIAVAKQVAHGIIVNRVGDVLVRAQQPVQGSSWLDAIHTVGEQLLRQAGSQLASGGRDAADDAAGIGRAGSSASIGSSAGVDISAGVDSADGIGSAGNTASPGGTGAHVLNVGIGLPLPLVRNPAIRKTATAIASEVFSGVGPLVVTENIVTMGAIAEACWGAGTSATSLLYIHLSSGIGSCFVMPQSVTGGVTAISSEIGHTVVPGSERRCYCGKIGCLETLATVPAVLEATGASSVDELARQLVRPGADPHAEEIVTRIAHAVGIAAANAVLMLNPQMVVVGGTLARSLDSFPEQVHRSLTENLLPAFGWDVPVARSAIDEWAAARGAALLAGQRLTVSHAENVLGGRA